MHEKMTSRYLCTVRHIGRWQGLLNVKLRLFSAVSSLTRDKFRLGVGKTSSVCVLPWVRVDKLCLDLKASVVGSFHLGKITQNRQTEGMTQILNLVCARIRV